jgi:hypothetical protein
LPAGAGLALQPVHEVDGGIEAPPGAAADAGVNAGEISVAALPGFRVRPAPVLRGLLYDRDQGQTP